MLGSIYHDLLRPYFLCLVSYGANNHRFAPNGLTKYLSLISKVYELR